MNHKWKKIEDQDCGANKGIKSCKECVRCGLMKGYIKRGYWAEFIYFNKKRILSWNKLPYKCFDVPKDIFIKEDEFKV